MSDITWVHREYVHLIWIAVAVVVALVLFELRGRDVLKRFVSAVMQRRLAEWPSLERRLARLALIFACLGLGVVALMRPQSTGKTEAVSVGEVSADIMVVLDVSKSMLAEDAAPNRLSRAKADIGDMLDQLPGHRVGLVAFAGRAAVLAPLTSDYGFFHMILRGTDSKSVSRGGTRIGDALRTAVRAFGADSSGARIILLITDGEDHESHPEEAARVALEAGVRVVAVGFGSAEGSEIRMTDPDTGAKTVLKDRDGKVVRTRLDEKLLLEISRTTEGAYVPAGVAALDLESIVGAHIDPLLGESSESSVRVVPVDHYRWFVLGSLVALCAAVFLGASRPRKAHGHPRRGSTL